MFTAKKIYAMLENESLWQTAIECHQLLAAAKVPHAVMGGVAVYLHGYQRNTTNVDLLWRREDSGLALNAVRNVIVNLGKFRKIRYLFAGEVAGAGSAVTFPDRGDEQATIEIEGLPVHAGEIDRIENRMWSGQASPHA